MGRNPRDQENHLLTLPKGTQTMRRKIRDGLLLAGLLGLVWSSGALAQRGLGPWGGWGPGSRYAGMYNPQALETLIGEVEQIEHFVGGKGMSAGVRLLLKTEKGTIPVMLGPDWYVEKQPVQLKVKDRVEITGCRGRAWGQTAFVAGEVKKDGQVLRLRDAAGVPLWAGQGWRRHR
jgi:hypothetical protein